MVDYEETRDTRSGNAHPLSSRKDVYVVGHDTREHNTRRAMDHTCNMS